MYNVGYIAMLLHQKDLVAIQSKAPDVVVMLTSRSAGSWTSPLYQNAIQKAVRGICWSGCTHEKKSSDLVETIEKVLYAVGKHWYITVS